jgi:hypothetical protein
LIVDFIIDVVFDGVSALARSAFRGRQRDGERQQDEEWAQKWALYADDNGLHSVGKGRRLVEEVHGYRVLIDPGTWCDAPKRVTLRTRAPAIDGPLPEHIQRSLDALGRPYALRRDADGIELIVEGAADGPPFLDATRAIVSALVKPPSASGPFR